MAKQVSEKQYLRSLEIIKRNQEIVKQYEKQLQRKFIYGFPYEWNPDTLIKTTPIQSRFKMLLNKYGCVLGMTEPQDPDYIERAKIGDLQYISATELLNLQGVGNTMIFELKAICQAAGVSMME